MDEAFNAAYKALGDAVEADESTAEELDALAKISTGHIYCHALRMQSMLMRR
jgi:hypothetical protein